MKVVVTFDLEDADAGDYTRAYDVLKTLGLLPVSLNKGLTLPSTTVMGELSTPVDAAGVRDTIWAALKRAGLKPSRIFGGVLEDWALTSG